MGADEILGWVDRRSTDVPVGRDRRDRKTRRLGDKKMTRRIIDWLYVRRWFPWAVMLLLLPPALLPPSFWLDVQSVTIHSAHVGAPISMTVEREVKRSFRGSWNVTIRQWDGGGWVTWCNASGSSNYRAEAKFPKNLSLQWWTDGACQPVPVGRYKVTTTWIVRDIAPLPDKVVTAESNVFEVTP